jgi:hypothetical protein
MKGPAPNASVQGRDRAALALAPYFRKFRLVIVIMVSRPFYLLQMC